MERTDSTSLGLTGSRRRVRPSTRGLRWLIPAALALVGFVFAPVAQGQRAPASRVQIQPSQSSKQGAGSARPVGNTAGSPAPGTSAPTTPPPPAESLYKPVFVGWASFASYEKLQQLARDAGFAQMPAILSPATIEQQFPFLGPGTLSPTHPVAFGFFAGRTVEPKKSAVLLFPVRPEGGSLDTLAGRGARPVPGATDTYVMGPMTYRRAAATAPGVSDYFVFGYLTDPVRYAKPEFFATPYLKGESLANVQIDFKALRQAQGDSFERYLRDEEMKAYSKSGRNGYDGTKVVTEAFRTLDRMYVAVDRPAGGLRVGASLQPFAFDAKARPSRFERPGFPAGVLFRADFAYPPRKALGFVDSLATRLVTQGATPELRGLTPDQQVLATGFFQKLVGVFLDGQAGSFAAESVKTGANGSGAPATIVYVISKRAQGNDIGTSLRQLAFDGEVLGRQIGQGPLAQLQAYPTADNATKAWRLILSDNNAPRFYIDAIQREQTVYLSATTHDGHHVERLLAPDLKPLGPLPSQTFAAGFMNPEAALRLLGPSGLSESDRATLFAALKGQRLTWTASAESSALTIDVSVPPKVLNHLNQFGGALDLK